MEDDRFEVKGVWRRKFLKEKKVDFDLNSLV